MTAEEFKALVGVEPTRDDLDRANCPHAGQPGHLQCGVCTECELPRSICGHYQWAQGRGNRPWSGPPKQ